MRKEAIEIRGSSIWGQETAGAPMSGLGRKTIPLDRSFIKIFGHAGTYPVSVSHLQDIGKAVCILSP